MASQPTVELECRCGRKSAHPLRRVLSRNDAWCPRCGASLTMDAATAEAERSKAAAAAAEAPEETSVAKRRVGPN